MRYGQSQYVLAAAVVRIPLSSTPEIVALLGTLHAHQEVLACRVLEDSVDAITLTFDLIAWGEQWQH